ncbi:MAG: anaerobic sulfatase maturase [Opitutales bacterium]|nr:anaerobic sulfatase maturase [Opitutales bacterium]
MTKPIGPKCNLDCKYCFYLEKESLWQKGERYKMDRETLTTYIQNYISSQPSEEVTFAWQGGEPTLMGLDFFETVVKLQKEYSDGKTIRNTLQTNGTLIDHKWGAFFHKNQFLIGVSIDGPQKLHDFYRVNKSGSGSWINVLKGIEILKKHDVEWNTLTCVHQGNSNKPQDVYRFLRGIGSTFMQFIPIVERKADSLSKKWGLHLGTPAELNDKLDDDENSPLTPWSVKPKDYGAFLCSIFDRWVKNDVGRIFIQINDVTLGKYLGQPNGICIFEETCGGALALEHDGSVYSCDHYVYPSFKLGNIKDTSMADLVDSPEQIQFGRNKKDCLPRQCIECPVKPLCNGGCPKQRFLHDKFGNPGLNYLCEGYYHYFTHTHPYMQKMKELYQLGRPPSSIMGLL